MKVLILVACALAGLASALPYGLEHHPIITKEGVPLETPEVQEAKIQHLVAHAVAEHKDAVSDLHHNLIIDDDDDDSSSSSSSSSSEESSEESCEDSSEEDSSEESDESSSEESCEDDSSEEDHHDLLNNLNSLNTHGTGYASSYQHQYLGPVIGHDGVPLDTPEVQAAKYQHLAAHAEALARNLYDHHPGDHYGGNYAHTYNNYGGHARDSYGYVIHHPY